MGLEAIHTVPLEIVEKILLLLPSRDIAAMVLAIPQWKAVISSSHFIRKHRARFSNIYNHIPLQVVIGHYKNKPVTDYGVCRAGWGKTPSNHCVACLLDPALLLSSIRESKCLCIDHMALYESTEVIIWDYAEESGEEKPWPTFWGFRSFPRRLR